MTVAKNCINKINDTLKEFTANNLNFILQENF